ncbi:coniferyl-alcohol dehydrogenase [Novosphingobium sp. G106]|uniref:coniferyl-alcohol dehydrogenase n=1 Tax=Novosphingobium sp. G106 TaxID=2849500 RepID=UPI001C2D7523|nr:coniferyl-alcohol dehydrogenase [Novosphingobium sp. G106]MBV1687917.1 coniferyl-alcohol dehydrogenase [Novosphingobium sp. G106]
MDILSGYRGKRVVVTGCHSGIGHATASLLLGAGAEVHGLDIKPVDLTLASYTPLDLKDPHSIESASEAIPGPIDALFNCAGVAPGWAPADVMAVNFIGTRYLTERLSVAMGEGSAIVSVASNGGAGWMQHLPILGELTATASFEEAVSWYGAHAAQAPHAYSFSKEAVIAWTLKTSGSLIRRGIRMNCTSPGAVQTPMLDEIEKVTPSASIDVMAQPIGRRSIAVEQAWPLLFLNSDAASYINGVVLPVDGGFLGAKSIDPASSLSDIGRK